MPYTVTAKWIARPGNEERVATAIRHLAPLSRAEPGCLDYRAHRSVSDPRVFLLYETYTDEAAYDAHTCSDHFVRFAVGDGIPLLERREREFFETFAE